MNTHTTYQERLNHEKRLLEGVIRMVALTERLSNTLDTLTVIHKNSLVTPPATLEVVGKKEVSNV